MTPDYFLNYRLRLESVKELSATGETGATYQFEYYGSASNSPDYYNLPYRLSAAQDHWGYYNYSYNNTIFPNNPANRTIAPDNCLVWGNQSDQGEYNLFGICQLPSIYGEPLMLASNLVTGGANREPDTEAVKAGTLNKIIYPTGGYTQFDFEPNCIDFTNTTQGSGIRIKQIESSDGNGNKIIKEYTYEPFWGQAAEYYSNPITSPYHTLYYNRITDGSANSLLAAMGVPSNLAYTTPVCVIKIDGASQIKLGIGMDPVYSKVTETIRGGGRTEYQYSNVDNIFEGTNSFSNPITINGISIYDAFTVVFLRTINTYCGQSGYPSVTIPPAGHKGILDFHSFPFSEPISNDWQSRLLTDKKTYREDGFLLSEDAIFYRIETSYAIPGFKVCQLSNYNYLYSKSYTTGGLVKVSQEVNRQYTPQGMVRAVKEYDYTSPFHKQITESRTWNSAGNLLTTHYYYPTEYGNMLSFLKDGNMLLPVDVRTYNGSHLISGVQKKYNLRGQTEIKYLFDSGAYDMVFNSGNPYTFTPYIWNAYDASGLWQTNLDIGGLSTVYLWSYKGQYPVAEIKNATLAEVNAVMFTVFGLANAEALSALDTPNEAKLRDGSLQKALPKALVTTYTYKPLVGIASMTDPRGVMTTYDYDTFNRLKTVKDNKSQPVEGYDYHYKN